jgi:signal transduction histidine kinase
MTWPEIAIAQMLQVFFVYGLAFFVLGVAVALEASRTESIRQARAMWPLAAFGILHALHEWAEMFVIIGQGGFAPQIANPFEVLHLLLLALSFTALIFFGTQNLSPGRQSRSLLWVGPGALLLYGLSVWLLGWWLNWQLSAWYSSAEALARYGLAIPGTVLAAATFLAQRRRFLRLNQPIFARDLLWAAVALLAYGVIGQGFVKPSSLFPSNIVNTETFQAWFGFPIQFLRAATAILLTVFVIRFMRSFEHHRQETLSAARQRVQEEIVRRDELRQEFLHSIVAAQEEERGRIARELHDELGQVLTGLAIGLRGVQSSLADPDLSLRQLGELEKVAVQALTEMRHLVTELRPAVLDDMGLEAALRHYIDRFITLTDVETSLVLKDIQRRLPSDIETILFRIAQEALTNIARHSGAKHAWVDLSHAEDHASLQIEDDGSGFDPEEVFEGDDRTGCGLLGIQERVKLANGEVRIQSSPGQGTTLRITIPLESEGGK